MGQVEAEDFQRLGPFRWEQALLLAQCAAARLAPLKVLLEVPQDRQNLRPVKAPGRLALPVRRVG